MKRKYEMFIEKNGLTGKKLSKTLTNQINLFKSAELEIEQLNEQKKAAEEAGDEEKQKQIQSQIDELNDDLSNADEELVISLDKYVKMLPVYLKKSAHMHSTIKGKAQAPPVDPVDPVAPVDPVDPVEPVVPVVSIPAVSPVPAVPAVSSVEPVTPVPSSEPTPTPASEPTPTPEPKKKNSDATWWIVAGLVAAVTLGAVILKRDD